MANTPNEATWFTPLRLLCLFCCMNLFVYTDRGTIAANGVNGAPDTPETRGYGIQGDFGLTLFQDGLLPAAFMVGLLVASPIFAEASKRFNALRLIGTGLGVWTLAVAGCGLSLGFTTLLLCRMAVGVGEASFVALASPFIDDNAPPDKKTRWLATFYLCIPTGYALGYIYGGIVASAVGWRAAFLLLAGAMVPFVVFCLRAPPIDIRGTHGKQGSSSGSGREGEGGGAAAGAAASDLKQQQHRAHSGQRLLGEEAAEEERRSSHHSDQLPQGAQKGRHGGFRAAVAAVGIDLWQLASHPVYLLAVGGMTAYTAVLGTFAFYGPKAGRDVFGIAPEVADMAFGAITVVTGIFGTLAGGVLLDRMGSSLRNALLLCAAGTGVGFLLIVLGFLLAPGFGVFSVVLAGGEFALFMTQAPSNAICMWSVPPGLRPFAMSMSVVAMHTLGDVPGPPLLGLLQGHLRNWRISMSMCAALLLLGAASYAAAMRAARTAVDYRNLVPLEEEREGGLEGEGGEDDEETGSVGGGGGEVGLGSGRLSPNMGKPLLHGSRLDSSELLLEPKAD